MKHEHYCWVDDGADDSVVKNGNRDYFALSWGDCYFDDRDDIVAVFDYDKEAISKGRITLTIWAIVTLCLFSAIFFVPFMPYGLLCCTIMSALPWCFNNQNLDLPHTAVTAFGVRHVQPATYGNNSHRGFSMLIPFQDIQAIDVAEGGNFVWIRTPSADGGDYAETGIPKMTRIRYDKRLNVWCEAPADRSTHSRLELSGLLEPCQFKKLVLSMKEKDERRRGGKSLLSNSTLTHRVLEILERGSSHNSYSEEVLFLELRDELRKFNEITLNCV